MSYKVKKENQQKAQKRIFVEHVIRLIKIFKVARERFRLKESNYEKVILTIDISKNTQTLILTIFSGAIATYEDS